MLCKATALLLLICALAWSDSDAMGFLGEGNELLQSERYEEAAAQFRQALAKDNTLDEARRNLGICSFELRDYAKARKLFEGLATGKDRTIATYYLGRIDLTQGRLDAAVAHLTAIGEAGDAHGNLLDGAYYLGVAYFKKEDFAKAINALQSWVAANPRDFRAHEYLARAFKKTERPADAAREFGLTRELHNYYTEGSVAMANCRSLLDAGDTAAAWQSCRPMLQTEDVDKAAALGMLFGQLGDATHAMLAWRKAVALDPDSPELNYNLSLACFQLNDMACAKEHAAISVAIWPEFPEANVLYGTILYMLAEDDAATKVLTRARELRPDDNNVQRLLSDLRSRAKQ